MSVAAVRQPVLDRAEWELVIELLERERRDLPVEIHHTATKDYRQRLRDRLKIVERLMDRLAPTAE